MDAVVAAISSSLGAELVDPAARFAVAFSGGLDSSVLLHAMADLAPGRLRALHVNHQIHADAGRWAAHCRQLGGRLGVPVVVMAVTVEPRGAGPEAAARQARYAALAAALDPGEILLTAHHRDDQAETLLINLLRGAGPAGLAGIPAAGTLGAGALRRPLLEVPRPALLDYGHRWGLAWVEDPANVDPRMDRNFLRHQVLPLLEARWPAARATLGRSAGLAAEAAALLEELAAADAPRVLRRGRVVVSALARLPEARRRNVMRYLCRRQLGSAPSLARLRTGLAQLLESPADRRPQLDWRGGQLRRYRGLLYLLPAAVAGDGAPDRFRLDARPGSTLDLGDGRGRLRLVRARGQGLRADVLPAALEVRFRDGGEAFRPAGSRHRRALKKLLQESGVVPWMRQRIPLLYADGRLVAVAGLWIAEEAAARAGEPGLRVRWSDHPALT